MVNYSTIVLPTYGYITSGAAAAYTSAITYANTQDDYHTTSANAYAISGAYVAFTSAKTYADWVYTSATTYANTQDDYHTTSANAYAVSGAYVALTSALVADATTLASAKTYADWVYTSATTYADTQDGYHTTSANAYAMSGAYVALTSALVADATTLASAKTYADWVYTSATTYANTQDDYHTTSANAYALSGAYVALTSALVADATTLASAKTYADWVYTSATTYADTQDGYHTTSANAYALSGAYVALTSANEYADWVYTSATTYANTQDGYHTTSSEAYTTSAVAAVYVSPHFTGDAYFGSDIIMSPLHYIRTSNSAAWIGIRAGDIAAGDGSEFAFFNKNDGVNGGKIMAKVPNATGDVDLYPFTITGNTNAPYTSFGGYNISDINNVIMTGVGANSLTTSTNSGYIVINGGQDYGARATFVSINNPSAGAFLLEVPNAAKNGFVNVFYVNGNTDDPTINCCSRQLLCVKTPTTDYDGVNKVYSDLNLDLALTRPITGQYMAKDDNDNRLAIYGGVQGSGNAVLVINSCSGSSIAGGFRFLTTKADCLNRQDAVTITGNTDTPVLNLNYGQIAFPSVQVPSAGANVLDDYEEGTWTPEFAFGGFTSGITYSIHDGYYTKVGNIVEITGRTLLTNKGTAVGALTITGLPFTIANAQNSYEGVALRKTAITMSGMVIQGYPIINTTTIAIEGYSTYNGSTSSVTNTHCANGTGLMIGFVYRTA
ncbi:MAG TPA: hypothetical protein PLW50_00470 [Smithellaceae bacterium]|nr:hypothetical protein [Smithellaceae bacterium]